MGIGNLRAIIIKLTTQSLITPHGDRKHVVDDLQEFILTNSLPLMGIGNLASPASCWLADCTLLPLMGIENRAHETTAGTFFSILSLPLMGIGNDEGDIRDATARDLITPHGDRKRHDALDQCHRHAISLPLMGIGNRAKVQ